MITFPANTAIFVVHTPVSFGCGIDGMLRYCRCLLEQDPLGRAYFLFINRSRTQIRCLWYDGQGFSLCTKRVSQGKFAYWPKETDGNISSILFYFEAALLFSGGDPKRTKGKEMWKKIV
jgi:transposase